MSNETKVGHCKADSTDEYIGRGPDGRDMTETDIGARGWLGNPYPEDSYGRERCIELFRDDFEAKLHSDEEFREAVADLAGKTLGCWCQHVDAEYPECHGEVIAEWADRLAEGGE